jgi:PleD family two-component response regulator
MRFPAQTCVLLIEDSVDARETLRTMLELAGHVVYAAADGVRGLELLNVVRPDVGIIGVSLLDIDGYQVAGVFGMTHTVARCFAAVIEQVAGRQDWRAPALPPCPQSRRQRL